MRNSLLAFVFVQTQPGGPNAATLLVRIPEVEEVHRVAGEDCYLVRVRVSSTEQLGRIVRNRIEQIKSVSQTRTTLVLKTLKDNRRGARKKPS